MEDDDSYIIIREGWIPAYYKLEEIVISTDNYREVYYRSIYFVVTTFSTIGYGDIKMGDNMY